MSRSILLALAVALPAALAAGLPAVCVAAERPASSPSGATVRTPRPTKSPIGTATIASRNWPIGRCSTPSCGSVRSSILNCPRLKWTARPSN